MTNAEAEDSVSGYGMTLWINSNDSMVEDPGQKPSGMTQCDKRPIPRTETLRGDVRFETLRDDERGSENCGVTNTETEDSVSEYGMTLWVL